MSSGVQRTVRGVVKGTGASLDVKTVGFRPSYVKLFNKTSRVGLEWNDTMADEESLKTAADGARTVVTSGAISPLSNGFRLGTDSVNAADEDLCWEATE